MCALFSTTDGISVVTENIFPQRYMHVAELKRMGAKVQLEGPTAVIQGVDKLYGAPVMASDLRASAAWSWPDLRLMGLPRLAGSITSTAVTSISMKNCASSALRSNECRPKWKQPSAKDVRTWTVLSHASALLGFVIPFAFHILGPLVFGWPSVMLLLKSTPMAKNP